MLFGRQAHRHCMKKKEREMRKNKKSFNFQSIIKVVIIRTEKQGSQKEDNLIILDCDLIRTYLEGSGRR
jgi:hypothetical protein